jgi:hypothetical protein
MQGMGGRKLPSRWGRRSSLTNSTNFIAHTVEFGIAGEARLQRRMGLRHPLREVAPGLQDIQGLFNPRHFGAMGTAVMGSHNYWR